METVTKVMEEWITALPLSYPACAGTGIEPATNVFFQVFAVPMELPTRGAKDGTGELPLLYSAFAEVGFEPTSDGIM
jgi:hypothetical protein